MPRSKVGTKIQTFNKERSMQQTTMMLSLLLLLLLGFRNPAGEAHAVLLRAP